MQEEEDDDVEEEDRSQDQEAYFVRACVGDIRMDISQEPFLCGNLKENGRGHLRGHHFVRACAVEMHMDISQEPFCVEIYREHAKRPGYHHDWTPGLNTYRKNPSVWPHCLGKNGDDWGILLWLFYPHYIKSTID